MSAKMTTVGNTVRIWTRVSLSPKKCHVSQIYRGKNSEFEVYLNSLILFSILYTIKTQSVHCKNDNVYISSFFVRKHLAIINRTVNSDFDWNLLKISFHDSSIPVGLISNILFDVVWNVSILIMVFRDFLNRYIYISERTILLQIRVVKSMKASMSSLMVLRAANGIDDQFLFNCVAVTSRQCFSKKLHSLNRLTECTS